MKGAILSMGLLAVVGSVRGNEKPIEPARLPEAVRAAAATRFPEAKVVRAELDEEDGKPTYDLHLRESATEIEMEVTPSGEILEVEKTIDAAKLPEAVAKAIRTERPEAKIRKAKLDEDRGTKVYEIDLTDGTDLKVSPEGKVLEVDAD